jgi:hypothetical protein
MYDVPDLAPAWLIPQLIFSLRDSDFVGGALAAPYSRHPSMPMLLPASDLFLRFAVIHSGSGHQASRELRLILLPSHGTPVLRCQAWRVTGALVGLLALYAPLAADLRNSAPIPVPEEFMPALELSQARLAESLGFYDGIGDPEWEGLMTGTGLGLHWPAIMPLLPALLLDGGLWRGAQYYLGSLNVFAFMGDDMLDTLNEPEAVPETPYRMVDAESAVWHAFKAVEAVIGDPSSDARKLRRHLDELGLMDFPGVWQHEEPVDLVARVSEFVGTRDRRAAHGRHHTGREPLTFYEIMDYQYFAGALLRHHASKVLEMPRP